MAQQEEARWVLRVIMDRANGDRVKGLACHWELSLSDTVRRAVREAVVREGMLTGVRIVTLPE